MTENDIRQKTRAVFLAALMVLSVVAVSVSFAGTAAAVNADAGDVNVDDFTITNSDEALLTENVTYTDNFDGTNNVGPVLGVPVQTDYYDDSFNFINNGELVTQPVFYTASLTLTANNTEDAVEVTLDISDATDNGLVVDESGSVIDGDLVPGSGFVQLQNSNNVSVNNDAGEIVVTVPAGSSTNRDIVSGLGLAVEAENPVEGTSVDGLESIEITASSNGDLSASDRFTAVESGVTGISDADTQDFNGSSSITARVDPDSSDTGAFAQFVGADLNVETPNTDTFEVYEASTDDSGNYTIGSRVIESTVTGEANTSTIDTSELGAGEYFVGFDENNDIENDQFVFLDLRTLDLSATADTEVTADDTLEIDVSANPSIISDTNDVQVWISEAGDNQISDVIYADQSELVDVTGETTFEVDPENDLDGTGSYQATILHEDSGIVTTTDTIEVTDALEPEVTIERPRQTDDPYTRGDLIEVQANLEGTDTATLTFGDRAAGQNVELNITVQTDSVGGTANFYLNTFQIGDGPVFNDSTAANPKVRDTGTNASDWGDKQHGVIAQDGTSLVNVEAHESIRIGGGSNADASRKVVIADGNYDLTASPGETAYTEENAISTDNSIVRIAPRSTGGLQAWNAPTPDDEADIADIEFADDIEAAIDEGLISPQDGTTADNDLLILQFETTGLEGLLYNQSDDPEEFLDRSDDHYVTEEFFGNNFISLATNQSQQQVEEIVAEVRAERAEERNLPQDNTFGAQATLDLEQQEVIAGTNDRDGVRNNLNEYFLTIEVSEENIEDNRTAEENRDGLSVSDTIDNLDENNSIAPDEDVVYDNGTIDHLLDDEILRAATEDDEIPTADERPVQFNTSFELGVDVNDDEAANFPENGLFGAATQEYLNWELTDDIVELNDVEETDDGPRIFVPAQNDYTVEGETSIAAGTSMTSQTQTASGEDPAFFYPNEFTVEYVADAPNTISFSENFFDSDEIEEDENFAGADFRMTIRRARLAGNLLENAPRRGLPGTVADITEVNAHTFDDQETGGTVVTVSEVNVSTNAVVEIRDADGNVLGSAEVPEGQSDDVQVVLEEDLEESQDLTSVIVDEDGSEFSEGPSSQTATITVTEASNAFIDVSNLSPVAATADPGQELTVTADVTNQGGATVNEQEVTFQLNGEQVGDAQTVSLSDGETTSVSFTVNAPEEAGTYTHAIASQDDSAEGQLTVEEPEPANFQLTLESGPSEVETGDSGTVEVTVENTGEVEGTQTVTFTFDGEEVTSEEVTLGAGETATQTYDVTAPSEAGDYDWTIASDDDEISETLTVTAPPSDDTGTDDTSTDDTGTEDTGGDDSTDSNGPGFGIAAALVALLGAALLAYRRQ